MAYRPSFRRSRAAVHDCEPNMTPIMNLMVVLIPLLLTSAQLIKLSVIELNLPPAKGAETIERPKEKKIKLDLAVTITDQGFYVSSSTAVMKAEKGRPSVPKKNGEYDYETLAQTLFEIKQKAVGRFEDTDSIVIQAEPKIDYQTLVSTMDASRSIILEGKQESLFPNVSVSASLL